MTNVTEEDIAVAKLAAKLIEDHSEETLIKYYAVHDEIDYSGLDNPQSVKEQWKSALEVALVYFVTERMAKEQADG